MNKIIVLLTLAAGAIFTAACSTPAAVPSNSSQPAATDVPVIAPTIAAVTKGVAPSGDATEVDVTLEDNKINSTLTTFQVGVPYTFVIKNTGNHAHNFNISTPVSITGSIDASLASVLLTVAQDKLPVGQSATVEYTFPDSAVGTQLEFSCLIRRHYDDGMLLAITVTK